VDLFIANYVDLDLQSVPKPGQGSDCCTRINATVHSSNAVSRPALPITQTAGCSPEWVWPLPTSTATAGEPFQKRRAVWQLETSTAMAAPEVIIVNMNEAPNLLKNNGPRGNWVRFVLEGSESNRSAIGARVTVQANGKRQLAEVAAGGSYYSQHELPLYFGLGNAQKIDRVEVRWPRGKVQVFNDVPVNQTIRYREGTMTASAR
jgi:hypothetical protein